MAKKVHKQINFEVIKNIYTIGTTGYEEQIPLNIVRSARTRQG